MKKLLSLLLISFGLHGQTLVKLKQVGDGQSTGSFVVTGAPNGALTTTPQALFVTTAQATSSYVPYSGATTSLNLGANSFSAGAQSTISTLYVPNTATVNGALKANSTLTVAGTSSFGPVYIAAPSTSTGLYIETDNTGNQFPLVINAHSGTNPVAVLQGTNNSIFIWKNIPTNNSWRAMNNVAATGAGLDSWGIGESANPVLNYFSITHTTGYGLFKNGLRVGSLTAPTKTFDVTGDAAISSSLTVAGISNSSTMTAGGGGTVITGTSGTVAVMTNLCFPIHMAHGLYSPGDGATLYFGGIGNSGNPSTTATYARVYIPVNCTLIGYDLNCLISGVAGSGESSTFAVRVDNTTDITLTSAMTYSAGSGINESHASNLNTNINAGSYINIKWTTPTWVTNPTNVNQGIVLWFKQR